jgi:hypothetical protein
MTYRLRRPEPTEAAVQAAVLHTLALDRRVAFAHRMNSGAAWLPGKGGKLRPVRFGFDGCPDVLGMMKSGRLLAVEVKRPSGKPTPVQERFLELVRAHGGVAGVVRSVDDLLRLLEQAPTLEVIA